MSLSAASELTAAVLITVWSDGRPAIVIVVCHAGDLGVGERLVQPVRNLGAPIVDTICRMSYAELQTMFGATNPPGPWHYRTGYLTSEKILGDDFVDLLLAQTNFPSPSPLSRIFTERLGGAVAHVPADPTAFVHRAAPFDLIVIAGGFRVARRPPSCLFRERVIPADPAGPFVP